ncbi:hypothetical protein V1638_01775 [Pseudarthrobacter sp. J64]|uniref:hypothetical protein n=1 Tax=Pseudarthrobacter sp. J64 TaxID=3116485 RepID=UPI002E7FB4A1|nr:hypothetical protein [Pseudarthrobacter sp. J64]MEE2568127.1 hypothetical protein [Pseudarthrobacter sp. J64]
MDIGQSPTSATAAKATGPLPETLELRIHGIRNTPPHELLRTGRKPLEAKDVELSWGDDLAGFYRAKADTTPAQGIGAPAASGSKRTIEAYSWGHLARFTGIGIANKIADAAVRTVWFLLMPFGLTNAAYWSRPLPRVRQEPATPPVSAVPGASAAAGGGSGTPPAASGGAQFEYAEAGAGVRRNGAGRIRLFALLLTLYFVATAAVVAMDLIAVQCFPADAPAPVAPATAEPDRTCAALPSFLDGMAGWTRGQRIALLSLVPLLGVGFLAGVAYLARTRFHPRPNLGGGGAGVNSAANGAAVLPTLMIQNLWDARKEVRSNGWLHLWASLAMVAAVISWDGVWTRIDGTACGDPGTFFGGCLSKFSIGTLGTPGVVMLIAWVAAVAALIAAGIETVRKAAANPDVPAAAGTSWMVPIFLIALASAAAAVIASVIPCDGGSSCEGGTAVRMLGLGTAPAALMAAMLLLIISMCVLTRKNYDTQAMGWWGRGSAVFCTLALGAATIMSCAVVGATAAVLQKNLERRAASKDGMWRFGEITDDALFPPSVFIMFSGLLLFVIILVAIILGICVLVAKKRMKSWNTEDNAVSELAAAYGTTPPVPYQAAVARKLVAARGKASLLHRAEAMALVLAVLMFSGLTAALVLGTFKGPLEEPLDWLYGVLEGAGALGLAAAGAAILALAITSAKRNSRPLALLWDLMCFMPKAAHPFGPPSYGERAVPEFAARIAAWLDGKEDSPSKDATKVVISAHSLGAVIAVSALFHLKAVRPDLKLNRIGLVTYGTQLRAYFGRFFPDLLGPGILATTPVSRTGLIDPGGPDTERIDGTGSTGPASLNLTHVFGPGTNRWINAYRKTDYLGFPVRYTANTGNPAMAPDYGDRYVQEMDPYTYQFLVTSHSDYLQAPQYQRAVDDVASALNQPAPGA